MDFKIKPKAGHIAALIFSLVLCLFGGFCLCAIVYDPKEALSPEQKPMAGIIAALVFTMAGFFIVMFFSSFNRHNSTIDIDSFTESEISDAIEKRWDEIRTELQKKR
jgi:hypothetical protein